MGAVQRAEPVRRLGGGDTLEDAGGHLDEGDVEALFCTDGRGLEPDIAAADDEDAGARDEPRGHAVGIGEVAHGEDAGQLSSDGGGQAAGAGAGGERERVIGKRRAVGQRHAAAGGVDGGGGGAGAQCDGMVGIPGGGAEVEAFFLHLAQEVGFGEGRALIGGDGFLADKGDLAVEAFGAEFRDERGAGLAGSDDDDMGHVCCPEFL